MSKMWRQTRTSGGRRLFRRDIEEKLKETASPFYQRRETRTTGSARRNPRSPEPVCDIWNTSVARNTLTSAFFVCITYFAITRLYIHVTCDLASQEES